MVKKMSNIKKFKHILDGTSKFIFRLTLAILIIIVPVTWVVQNDPKIQVFLKNKIIDALQREWKAKIDIESSDLNLFTGKLVLRNGLVKSFSLSSDSNPNCWWKFDKAYVKLSRLACFFEKKLVLKIYFYNVLGKTTFKDGSFSVQDHLKNVFTPSKEFEVDLKRVELNNINFNIDCLSNTVPKNIDVDVQGCLFFKKNKSEQNLYRWQGALDVKNGTIKFDQKVVMRNIVGRSDFSQNIPWGWVINLDNKFNSVLVEQENFFNIKGKIENGEFKFVLFDQQETLDLKATATGDYKFDIKGCVPVEFAKKVYDFINPDKSSDLRISGGCDLDMRADFSKEFVSSGKADFENLKINDFNLNTLSISFSQNPAKVEGQYVIDYTNKNFFINDLKASGEVVIDLKKEAGKFFVKNLSKLDLLKNYLSIKPESLQLVLDVDKNFNCSGKYNIDVNANIDSQIKTYSSGGDCSLVDKKLKIWGKNKEAEYLLEGLFKPRFYLTKLDYKEKDQKIFEVIGDLSKDAIPLRGKIQYSLLNYFLPSVIKRNVLGKAAFMSFDLEQDNYDLVNGDLHLSGGKFSVLGMYNPIKEVNLNFSANLLSKELVLNDVEIDFFKGKITSPCASIFLKDDYSVDFVHIPLQVDDFLINVKKYFYGIVYGNLMVSKNSCCDKPEEAYFKIFGDLVLRRSLFKENMFRQETNGAFVDFLPMGSVASNKHVFQLDVNLSCEKPMSVKTSFIQSSAALDLNLHSLYFNNKFQIPHITGSIDLEKGTLDFLYNKLFINYGRIQFLPNQNGDPMIDLVAQNRIKKYLISLQVTGSLQNPNIVLESSPELTEEQILSLLFAGSENVSFHADFPTIFMQNINKLIMGSRDIFPKNNAFFKKLTLPLKYVQITPDFTNSAGYGGIKGTVSVDLNNQIHAQIQKNFNLQEDLAFQVEYFLTDDINLKVVRDQTGEIGSEVEVRLKF
jgi:hypothetical protein